MLICEAVEPDGMTCRACEQYKRLDEYYVGKNKYGLQSRCKSCQGEYQKRRPEARAAIARKAALKRLCGTTLDQVEAMWVSQDGLCASCDDPLHRGAGGYATDHNHDTGKLRALLCQPCNLTEGQSKGDVRRLRKLADYLERHNAA